MNKRIAYENIFTPQGMLGEVSKKPNLDFLMNIFKIPRIYGVSGFGDWNVGQHTMATAFLALYWATFNKYPAAKRDRMVTLALLHDAHEAVVGDILPFFKTDDVRDAIDRIQKDILDAFSIEEDETLREELKLIDMISFLYEISQSKPSGLDLGKQNMLQRIYRKQKGEILLFASKKQFDKKGVSAFLKKLNL